MADLDLADAALLSSATLGSIEKRSNAETDSDDESDMTLIDKSLYRRHRHHEKLKHITRTFLILSVIVVPSVVMFFLGLRWQLDADNMCFNLHSAYCEIREPRTC